MRRYISLACVALIIVTFMVSPVSAADSDFGYFDVLEYSSIFPEGNLFTVSQSQLVELLLPSKSTLAYVDVVFKVHGVNITGVNSKWNEILTPLTLVHVGSNIWRAYGKITFADYQNVSLVFYNQSESYTTVDLVSCHVSTLDATYFDTDCYCAISTVSYDASIHYVPGDEVNHRTFTGTNNYLLAAYGLDIYNLDWRKYDFIDFLIFTNVDSVSSINCTMGGLDVPFTVSFIDNDSMSAHDFMYSIRIDCRGLDRSSSDYPFVHVTGNVITNEPNLIGVVSCVGVIQQNTNVVAALFRSLINTVTNNFFWLNGWIDSQTQAIVSALTGDSSAADQMQQEVNQKAEELEDLAGVMNSVNKPDVGSINVNVDSMVDQNILATSMSGFTNFLMMPYFVDIFIMSLILATAGYVLYGKR